MATQTHLITRPLRDDPDVHALFAIKPCRKAILFIHGYTGDALATWSDFPGMLPGHPKFAGHDLYFYGYDGLRAPVGPSAALFRQLLESMFGDTAAFVNQNLSPAFQRKPDFGYDELIIVAHSLGAVITRQALLDATTTQQPWVQCIKMVLYAPAHKGATLANLALETVSSFSFLKWFPGAARIVSPLIDELDPSRSNLLQTLENETVQLCDGGKNSHLVAKKIIWAERENVVITRRFGSDPPADTIKGTTHTTVCKPKPGSRKPLNMLEDCV